MSNDAAGGNKDGGARERAAAFVNDETTERMIRQCFADLGGTFTSVRRGDIQTAIAHLADHRSPQALIVDISGVEMPISKVHELADVCEAGVSVLAIGDSNDVGLYRNLLQTGISEYVVKPASRSMLQNAVREILGDEGDAGSGGATIVAVIGTRGGVGASTIAANVAYGLSGRKGQSAALLDLDFQHAGCDLLLGAEADSGLFEALQHPDRVDALYMDRIALKCDGGVALFATRTKPGTDTTRFDPKILAMLVEILGKKHRYVVLDATRANPGLMAKAMELARDRIIVVDQTTLALRDLIEITRSFAPQHGSQRNIVVLNRFGEPGATGIAIKAVEQALGLAIDAVVPFEAKSVIAAANDGVPVVKGGGPVAKAILAIVEDICGQTPEPEEQKRWWKFFGQ